MDAHEHDVVIVGGGTAGSVLARRLADATELSVVLLEAGPSDEGDERILPVKPWMSLLGGQFDYDYEITPQERGNGRIRHSRAKVLGGCSSHNSCIAFLTPDRDLDDWVKRGATGWSPAEFAPYLDRVKERVHISEPPEDNAFNHVVLEAAAQAGIPTTRFNQGSFEVGAGRFQLNVKDGTRQSSSVAYLHPLTELPSNLEVRTGVWATEVVVEGGRATAVETDAGTFRARHEVVLCAGAFDTPKLLQLSGIGPAAHLREHGIEVLADLPVGDHLLDHPEGVVNTALRKPLPPEFSQRWEAGIFACVEDDDPDLMFHVGLEPFTINTAPAGYPRSDQAFALTPNVCRARSEGTVRLRSADPTAPPLIDFRYFTDPDGYDERIMLAGVKLAREILSQPALGEWVDHELTPGADVTSDEALSHYARTTANTVYHPAGTCRMGSPDDPGTVVDPELRVHGIEGLRVADASVFPSMTSVNPAITVFAIGEKAADLVAGTG